jgi:hypothetical protein
MHAKDKNLHFDGLWVRRPNDFVIYGARRDFQADLSNLDGI